MSRPSPGVRWSGLGLAALAFLITRLLVADAVQSQTGAFVAAGMIPLVAGLALALFGMVIAIGAVTHDYARTVWTWAVIGTVAMILVLAISALHTVLVGEDLELLRENGPLVANVLLGGTILGTIVGDRSARHRRTNERLIQYAERTMLVNRLLRHEILNAVAIVKGYASSGDETIEQRSEAIRESTEEIERTVEYVGQFAGTTGELQPVDLAATIDRVLAQLPAEADVTVEGELHQPTIVRADDRLELLLHELLENAIHHGGDDPSVGLSVDVDPRSVSITVSDDGPGLPETAEAVLATRTLPEYDDPTFGYGLQMVRLLVEHYDGSIVATTENGTTVSVQLQRTPEHTTAPLALGVPKGDIYRASAAALVAGGLMGLVMQLLGGTMPVIGSLYGVANPTVGWVTHLFHSLVFGLLFAGGCTLPYGRRFAESLRGLVGLGVAWGVALWLVAAGVVMPIWLMSVGVEARLPNLTALGLLGHVVWGLALGAGYARFPDPVQLRESLRERFPELSGERD